MTVSPVKLWRRQKKTSSLIHKKGKILLWTLIRVPAKNFLNEAPYPVVIVKLENGKRMVGQLVDYENKHLEIGQQIVVVLRRAQIEDKVGIIPYVLKFKPL